ncbi:MAG: ribonuclease III [Phycisphaeraceae bacterium]|nr:ribonuclease III [Phycisphaerales bacterium]QOJ16097.1 MAG: ribonuclease III [Phycisphaeraceae bacterium]
MSQAIIASSQDLIARAESILGRAFVDRSLLGLALTHASSADHRLASNERLEFLGDAVLGLIVCEYLFAHYPELQEGDLTKIKSAVVSRDTCARVADDLGLTDLIVLGKGMSNRGAIPRSLSAGVYEAVIGALFLDAGLEFTRSFVLGGVKGLIRSAVRSGHQQNFKSVLQQLVQQNMGISPQYLLLDEKGPDHAKCFEICVEVGAQRFPSSWGRSKKAAEQQAALNALIGLGYATMDEDEEVRLCACVEPDAVTQNGHAEGG